ncbi:MAG: hypothetical protein ACO3B3_03770 [Cyanobium sp.]
MGSTNPRADAELIEELRRFSLNPLEECDRQRGHGAAYDGGKRCAILAALSQATKHDNLWFNQLRKQAFLASSLAAIDVATYSLLASQSASALGISFSVNAIAGKIPDPAEGTILATDQPAS